MDDKLRNLKDSMDNTVLKSGLVTPYQQQKILEEILSSKKRPIRKDFLAPILSIVLTFSFVIGLGIFIYNHMEDSTMPASPKTAQPKNSINTIEKNDHNEKTLALNEGYIVMNGYLFKETSVTIDSNQLGEKIGEVKRTGNWEIKLDGDSNKVPIGPLFSINGKDSTHFIAGKLVLKNGKSSYEEFEKFAKVDNPDLGEILSAKMDETEINAAIQNVKKKIGIFYSLDERFKPISFSYINGPLISLAYNIPEGDKDSSQGIIPGELYIQEYSKNVKLTQSRFIKPIETTIIRSGNHVKAVPKKVTNWKEPTLIKTLVINNINWQIYKDDYYHDLVIRGETDQYDIEISTQGNFTQDLFIKILKYFNVIK